MARNLRNVALVGAILLPLVAASGCTGTDMITAGNGSVRFTVTLTNSVNAARFEILGFTVNQIELIPADPEAAAALGGQPLGLFSNAASVNLAAGYPGTSSVVVPAGSYIIERFSVNAIQITDAQGPGPSSSCAEYIASFPTTVGAIAFIDGQDFDPSVIVNLEANTTNTINLTVDGDRFVEAVAAGWACQKYSTCPGQTNPTTVWCARPPNPSFSGALFKNRNKNPATQYFSFD